MQIQPDFIYVLKAILALLPHTYTSRVRYTVISEMASFLKIGAV